MDQTSNPPFLPLPIVELMVAFFTGTITNPQQDALDSWIEMSSEHLYIFESLVDIAHRTR